VASYSIPKNQVFKHNSYNLMVALHKLNTVYSVLFIEHN